MEVWVTNRNGTTTETRDVVGLANLRRKWWLRLRGIPTNGTIRFIQLSFQIRVTEIHQLVFNNLIALGLQPVQDFEKTFARKLDSTQYIYQPPSRFYFIKPAITN